MSTSTCFKVYFSSENIRRFNTPARPSYEEFVSLLINNYPSQDQSVFRLQYIDKEDDRIDVTTELEWQEIFSQSQSQNPIKVYILEIPNTNTTVQEPSISPPLEQNSDISSNVTKCLEQFFPNGIILPFNIPPFLSPFVNVINILGNTEVDLSVDISGLSKALHEKALADMDLKLYKEASHTFRAQGILQPENPEAFYHVACVESLMANTTEALLFLNKAIDLGYLYLDNILQDKNLSNISSTKGFQLAIHRLREILKPVNVQNHTRQETVISTEPVKIPEEPVKFQEPVKITESVKISEEPVKFQDPVKFQESEKLTEPFKISCAYPDELEVLHDIGYLNDEFIIPILEKNKGNFHQTVLELLDM